MKKLTRFLFAVADTAAFLQILVTFVLLVRMLGNVLTISFSTASVPSGLVLSSWGWFVVALVTGALGLFGCYLHLKRQVLGVFLIAFVLLPGLLTPYASSTLFVVLVPAQIAVYALPWSLMYLDLKRNGAAPRAG